MFNIEKKEVYPGIFSFKFDNQYETCSTFLRLQEFYESPFEGIKGSVFSLEEYMDRYAKETGNFTYTVDWGGFNVPGDIVREFFKTYEFHGQPLLEKEKTLYNLVKEQLDSDKKFYIIGHYGNSDLDWTSDEGFYSVLAHEISHGLFYLNVKYRKAALKLISELPSDIRKRMGKRLLKNGAYCKTVLKDEFQAYLSTSSKAYLREIFNLSLGSHSKPFKKLLKEHMNQNVLG